MSGRSNTGLLLTALTLGLLASALISWSNGFFAAGAETASQVWFDSDSYTLDGPAVFHVRDSALSTVATCTATWDTVGADVEANTPWNLATGEPYPPGFSLSEGCGYDQESPAATPLVHQGISAATKRFAATTSIPILATPSDSSTGDVKLNTAVNASSTLVITFPHEQVDQYTATDRLARVHSPSDPGGEWAALSEVGSGGASAAETGLFRGAVSLSLDASAAASGDGVVLVTHGDRLTVAYHEPSGGAIIGTDTVDLDLPQPPPTATFTPTPTSAPTRPPIRSPPPAIAILAPTPTPTPTPTPPPPPPPPPRKCEFSLSAEPVIKGNIGGGGERVYHLPGGPYYARTRIDESKGERWFCTVAEAAEAGWRPPARAVPATHTHTHTPTPTPQPTATPTPSPTPSVSTGAYSRECELSPSGEPVIKGNIGGAGERIYHLPGGPYYARTRIDESKGERWFCTVAEAAKAGWRPAAGAGATATHTPSPTPQPTPTPTPPSASSGADSRECELSPSGEPVIKGNIGGAGERIYHLPGGPYYARTRIDESKGERWFCTVAEAAKAGWRPAAGAGATTTHTPSPTPQPTPTPTPPSASSGADSRECELSPSGEPVIKGNIDGGGERIYHLPGGPYYARTRIDESKGERWFCTVAQAAKAGWRPSATDSAALDPTEAAAVQAPSVAPTAAAGGLLTQAPRTTASPSPAPRPSPTVAAAPPPTTTHRSPQPEPTAASAAIPIVAAIPYPSIEVQAAAVSAETAMVSPNLTAVSAPASGTDSTAVGQSLSLPTAGWVGIAAVGALGLFLLRRRLKALPHRRIRA